MAVIVNPEHILFQLGFAVHVGKVFWILMVNETCFPGSEINLVSGSSSCKVPCTCKWFDILWKDMRTKNRNNAFTSLDQAKNYILTRLSTLLEISGTFCVSIIIENLLNKWRSLTENFQVSLVSGLKCICILIVSPSIYNFIIL